MSDLRQISLAGRVMRSNCAHRMCATLACLVAFGSLASSSSAELTELPIGQSEHVYTLADENAEIRGLDWDESSADAARLFVLDRSGKVFVYTRSASRGTDEDSLEAIQTYDLLTAAGSAGLASPRGLVYVVEQGHGVLYFLDWGDGPKGFRSRLWRYDLDDSQASSVDLSLFMFRIGDREVLDLAHQDGQLLVSFDASGHADQNLRVQRGLLRIEWVGGFSEQSVQVQHLPDAGTAPARGLATMQLDGVGYLWATVGNDYIYCAELRTGRGLFFFERPTSHDNSQSCWGLCFGQEALWVSENVPGADRVHRVNVTRNLDASFEGPRVLRRLVMTIQTEPETDCADAGTVYHNYSRPYSYEQLHNQGIWPATETVRDMSAAANATIRQMIYDPAGDSASRQIMQCVEYASAPARSYSSQYEIDLWMNPYKKFVYPHRVNQDCDTLKGTDYLADDPELFNLHDTATYSSFMQRVRAHIEQKYGVDADMQNPYWAARNIDEYIQDKYYYPNPPKRIPATVDYDRQHYDANPGNLKIALSARPYDKTQIIACSGTSVMVAGAMRYLGVPARWLGTGTPQGPEEWDTNANTLLDPEEMAPCTNGHRYSQVWLGNHYGWICFDATPSKPESNDYDPPPPLQSQWRYMTRAASGHRLDNRIVFNVGSQLFPPLYRDFEYDEQLAVDNNCGGDQRYNLQGRCDKPELWKLPRHRIHVKNLCSIDPVTVSEPGATTRVTWARQGAWDRIADATVSLHLQQSTGSGKTWRDVARLAKHVPSDTEGITLDLSQHNGKRFRVMIRHDGDSETGGTSAPFDLE